MANLKYDFYIAGPMRGYVGHNHRLFIKAARLLREYGYTIWNPVEHNCVPDASFNDCMVADLDAIINKCRGVVFLPGWRGSEGANAEAFCAKVCGKPGLEFCSNGSGFNLTPVDLSMYRLPYNPIS